MNKEAWRGSNHSTEASSKYMNVHDAWKFQEGEFEKHGTVICNG